MKCSPSFRITRPFFSVLFALLLAASATGQVVEHRLSASDAADIDFFGQGVAISGDRAVIGAPLDDDLGTNSGSAYIFELQGDGSWLEIDKLIPSDGAEEDRCCNGVSISGDFAVIGNIGDDDNGTDSGSAYAFERQGNGSWMETDKLLPADGVTFGQFGFSVSILGGRVLIGTPGDDDGGAGSGSAYIFERQGDGSWTEVAKLTASDGNAGANFGFSVSLDGHRALVGAHHDPGGTSIGAAYVFERQGDGSWPETDRLTASDGIIGDIFGVSVSLSGDHALIGASNASPQGNRSGAAYAFERQGDSSWIETDKLLPSDGVELDFFGFSIAVEGDNAAVGAYAVATDGDRGDGALYAFERQGDATWMELDKLIASDGMSAQLGISLSLSEGRILGGADASDTGRGAAYLYENVFPVALEPTPDPSVTHRLSGIYPNPNSRIANFSLAVSRPQFVRIEVVTVLGRRQMVLHEGPIPPQTAQTFRFDAGSVPSGMYLIRVIGETFLATRAVTVSK